MSIVLLLQGRTFDSEATTIFYVLVRIYWWDALLLVRLNFSESSDSVVPYLSSLCLPDLFGEKIAMSLQVSSFIFALECWYFGGTQWNSYVDISTTISEYYSSAYTDKGWFKV